MSHSTFYTVSFLNVHTGSFEMSRTYATIRMARKAAKWYSAQGWASEVKIYKGGAGGEVVA